MPYKHTVFFTEQSWQQLLNILQQEFNVVRTLDHYTGRKSKTFAVSVQQLADKIVAIILREEQNDSKPYLQFVEQHVSPVLTTDLQGRIIHQNIAATSLLPNKHHCLIGLDIFSLVESEYLNEFKLLFSKTIRGSAFGMPMFISGSNVE